MAKLIPFAATLTQEGDWHRLTFKGSITEEAKAELMRLATATGAGAKVLLDLAHVTFINSCGIRDWSFFLKAIREGREVAFDRVTEEIIYTMNMVLNFHSRLPVRSLFRGYACTGCGHETRVQLALGKDYQVGTTPEIPEPACAVCGDKAEPSEPDDEFFQFLVA